MTSATITPPRALAADALERAALHMRWVVPALFVLGLSLLHHFQSPMVIALGGIEFHPRELLLLALFAQAFALLALGMAELRPHTFHLLLALYLANFLLAQTVGVARGAALPDAVRELRFGIFAASYFALVWSGAVRQWVPRLGSAIVAAVVPLAFAAAVIFFARLSDDQVQLLRGFAGVFAQRIDRALWLYNPRGGWLTAGAIAAVAMAAAALCVRYGSGRPNSRGQLWPLLQKVWRAQRYAILAWASMPVAICLMFAAAWCLSRAFAGPPFTLQNYLGEYTRREYYGILVQTVRPSGHVLFEIALVVLAGIAVSRAWGAWPRALACVLIALFAAGIWVSFMRTAYAAVLVSLVLLAWLHLPRGLRFASAAAVCAAGILLLLYAAYAADDAAPNFQAVDVSLRARMEEMRGAWGAFESAPLLGTGLGSRFEAFGWVSKTSSLAYGQASFQSIHNAWMHMLLKGGVVGMALVVFSLGGILLWGVTTIDKLQAPRDRVLLRGIIAAFAGQLIASFAMPRLLYPQGQMLIALLACAIFVYVEKAAPAAARASSRV